MEWECDRCGESMKKNTTECPACGHTIHSVARSSGSSLLSIFGGRTRRSRPASVSGGSEQWRCAKCNHIHEKKPFTCHECGSSWLQPFSTPASSADSSSGETISNVSEIESGRKGLLDYLLMSVTAVYLLVWAGVRFWKVTALLLALVAVSYYVL